MDDSNPGIKKKSRKSAQQDDGYEKKNTRKVTRKGTQK
jgi:hypothetical protein